MYKIGEFSKISDIPIRTLRFYEEAGLLFPSYVDEFTGYRYYSKKELVESKIIKYLKLSGFTLKEIAEYKSKASIDIINNKYNETKEEIKKLEKRLDLLSNLKESFCKNSQNDNNKVKVLVR